MIRYRDGKIVSTKGERFTQVTKAESEEMKKSYVNIPNYDYGYIWQRLDICNNYHIDSSAIITILVIVTKSIVAVKLIALYEISFLIILYVVSQLHPFNILCNFLRTSINFINYSIKNLTKVEDVALKHKVLWQ